MKYLIMLIIAIAIQFEVNCQISDSLFSSYKNFDLKIHQLEINGFLGGSHSDSDLLYNLNGGANYSKFTNLKRLQSDNLMGAQLGHSKNRNYYSGNEAPIIYENNVRSNIYHKSRYYPKNKLFYGYGYEFFYSFRQNDIERFLNPDRLVNNRTHNINIEIPFSIGIGRKYPVQSIHKSLWIYSELQNNRSLKRDVSHQEIEQLAHLIDDNNYTRFFDSRLKRSEDLGRIDSLLQAQDIITSHDIRYFTTMYDMYYYSSGSNRNRGRLIEGGLIGEFYYFEFKQNENGNESGTYNRAITPVLFVEFQNY